MINKRVLGILLLCAIVLMPSAFAAPGDETNDQTTDNPVLSLINPAAGLQEVLESPAGGPIKKVLNLFIGGCLLYTIYALGKDYSNSLSDNSEKSSSGFVGMGTHTVGLLVLLVCLGFVGYFMNYQL